MKALSVTALKRVAGGTGPVPEDSNCGDRGLGSLPFERTPLGTNCGSPASPSRSFNRVA